MGKPHHFWPIGGIVIALALATGGVESQTATSKVQPKRSAQKQGKGLFESACSVCHGLDGKGGEHAPGIGSASTAKSMADSELVRILHDGIPNKGMPSFSTLGDLKIQVVVSYLRRLQGKTNSQASTGNPEQGKETFFGKAGCAECHAMHQEGRFLATDLSDFAANHDANEIRTAIVNPLEQELPPRSMARAISSSGEQFSGVIRNEDNSSIQIQSADGQFYLLMKSHLKSIERLQALSMPVDYGRKLRSSEIEDLVSYIVQQSPTPNAVVSHPANKKEQRLD